MKVSYIRNYEKFKDIDLTLALGFFDGVHKGHMKVLKEALIIAKENNSKCGILTFNESVYDFINKNEIKNLTTINAKIDIVKELGFDSIYIIELTDEFINLTKDEFINYFLKNMNHIVVGFDYTFGKNREGNTSYLKSILKDKVTIVDKEESNNIKIGTQEIKNLLSLGNVIKANGLLDREYFIEGYIHKRNKFYSISPLECFIPRNGLYLLKLIGNGIEIEFTSKIKMKEPDNNIVLKPIDFDLDKFVYPKHTLFKILFKNEVSKDIETLD